MADLIIAPGSVPFSGADRKPSSGTPQYATSGNPASSIGATIWPAYIANMLVSEMRNFVVAGGLTPDGDNWSQLWQSVLSMQYFVDVGSTNSIVINPPGGLPVTTRTGQVINVTIANTNNGPTFLNFSGFVAGVVRPDGQTLKQGDIVQYRTYRFVYNGVNWILQISAKMNSLAGNPNGVLAGYAALTTSPPDFTWDTESNTLWVCAVSGTESTTIWTPIAAGTKPLTANADYYVNPATGNDGFDGLTPGTPWQTINHAWNFIQNSINMRGFQITVHLAPGTYAPAFITGQIEGQGDANDFIFLGDVGTPTNVMVAATTTNAFTSFAPCTVRGLSFRSFGTASGQGHGLVSGTNSGVVNVDRCTFLQCDVVGMIALSGGNINIVGDYTVAGSGFYHVIADQATILYQADDYTITCSGTPTFSSAFMTARFGGVFRIDHNHTFFTGAALGPRFVAAYNGIINTAGSDPDTYLPGNADGSESFGGHYL